MRKFLFILAALTFSFAAQSALADPGGPQPTLPVPDSASVEALIQQMTDADPTRAVDVQEQLLDIGEPARNALSAASRNAPDAGTRACAEYMLTRLGSSLRPTRISLHLKNVSAYEAIEAISDASGMALFTTQAASRGRLASTRISIDADRQPYWLVVRNLCQAARVKPSYFEFTRNARALTDEDGGCWTAPTTSIDGAIAVALSHASSGIEINPGDPAKPKAETQVHLEIFAETNSYTMLCDNIAITSCTNQEGKELRAIVSSTPGDISNPPRYGSFTVVLDRPGRVLSTLQGSAMVFSGFAVSHTEVNGVQLARALPIAPADLKGTLIKLQREGASAWTAYFSFDVSTLTDTAARDFRHILEHSPPQLFDAEGRPWGTYYSTKLRQENKLITVTTRYTRTEGSPFAPANPDRLVWDLPTKAKQPRSTSASSTCRCHEIVTTVSPRNVHSPARLRCGPRSLIAAFPPDNATCRERRHPFASQILIAITFFLSPYPSKAGCTQWFILLYIVEECAFFDRHPPTLCRQQTKPPRPARSIQSLSSIKPLRDSRAGCSAGIGSQRQS